jgi:mRNA interferase MazF
MKRGEVYWANLRPRSGSEQSGRRPVIVISHDGFNEIPNWRSIMIVPLSTSENQARRGPTAIWLPKGTAGIQQPSVGLCHQLTTLDRAKLENRIGTLPTTYLKQIEVGIKAALSLD